MNWNQLSKKKKVYAAGFGALVMVLLWAFISAGVITHDFKRSQLKLGEDSAHIQGIILTETKNEVKYWEIYGETGKYDSKNEIAMMDNVVGNIYKDNEVAMSFESSHGSYNSVKKKIVLYDNTHIVLKDGITLRANRLEWEGADKPVTAHGNVKITRGREFLAKADDIEISPDYNRIKIKGHTSSKIYKVKG